MTAPIDDSMDSPWEGEAQRIAPALDSRGVVFVLGADPLAAAELAIAAGRLQAKRRRVVIVDMVGELPPIQHLIPADAPYGIEDVLVHGVSLSKVVHPVDRAHNLLLVPSGPAPLDRTVLEGESWRRLAAGFREVGALLLVVAPAEAPPSPAVLRRGDAVVLVGDVAPPLGAGDLIRAAVTARAPISLILPETRPASERLGGSMPRTGGPRDASRPPLTGLRELGGPDRGSRMIWLAVGLVVVAGLAAAGWMSRDALGRGLMWARALARERLPVLASRSTPSPGAAAGAPSPVTEARRDTAAPAAVTETASTGVVRPLAADDLADSATATGYAVELVEFGSVTAANSRIEQEIGRGLPAVTYAPLAAPGDSGRRMFHVIAGAFPTRADAIAWLRALRTKRLLAPGDGAVIYAPFALLVQRHIPREDLSFFLNGYRLKGLPVYALVQADGTVNVYAGAFPTAEAAQSLVTIFRAAGEEPRVVYRTGRVP
jgi:hypothetical protein